MVLSKSPLENHRTQFNSITISTDYFGEQEKPGVHTVIFLELSYSSMSEFDTFSI